MFLVGEFESYNVFPRCHQAEDLTSDVGKMLSGELNHFQKYNICRLQIKKLLTSVCSSVKTKTFSIIILWSRALTFQISVGLCCETSENKRCRFSLFVFLFYFVLFEVLFCSKLYCLILYLEDCWWWWTGSHSAVAVMLAVSLNPGNCWWRMLHGVAQ